MSEWPMVKLGELGKWAAGGTPSRLKAEYFGGIIPWASIADLNDGFVSMTMESITELGLQNSSAKIYPKGSILIAMYGSIGKLGINVVPMASNQAIACFIPNETLERDYAFWALYSLRSELIMIGRGGTQKNIGQGILKEQKIPLPPLGEQKRIAEILGGVANAIHTVEQQIETANQLEKSLFNQFRRQYSALCSPIKNICKVQTGATPSRKNSAYYDGGIPWVKTGEVNGGKIEETEEYITELAVQETNCRKFPIGTILVAMYGQGATRGKVGILNCAAATNQACAALIALACEDQEYIFAVLRNCYDELRNLGRGGTQPNLNLTLVKEFEIPWPEEFAREEFSQKWREL